MEINEAFERYLQFCMFEKQLTNVTITDYKDDFKKFLYYFPNIKLVFYCIFYYCI